MKSLLALKCPSCKGNLSVEEGREFTFCQFCGTKILLNDENRYTYRHIDDAEVKRAENERMALLSEMELENNQRTSRIIFIVFWLVISLFFVIFGAIISSDSQRNYNGTGNVMLLFGMIFSLVGLVILPKMGRRGKRK